MRFGVSLVCDDIEAYPSWVRTVEQSGYSIIGLTDSPALYYDTYVTGSLCALNTRDVLFGPRVTNPLSRHPVVTACAIASLNALSHGRAILGIGTGDSAVQAIGRRPASLRDLEEYVRVVRSVLGGERYPVNGRHLSIPWAENHPVPIYIAAAGPNALELAGRIGDGVIIGSGILPEVIQESIRRIKRGAEAAGRDWKSLDLWWTCGCRIEVDRATADDRLLSLTAAILNSQFQVSLEGKSLPDALRDDVAFLVSHYEFNDHVKIGGSTSNAALLESLPELRNYASRRYTIGGTPDDCVRQIREAAGAGAKQFWLTAPFADRMAFVVQFGSEVLHPLAFE
jgi:5,10-methylenetetrahydromethanopterin reductase